MKFTRTFALLTTLLLGSTLSYANNHTCTYLYTYNGKVYKFTETRTTLQQSKDAALKRCKKELKSHYDLKDKCAEDICN